MTSTVSYHENHLRPWQSKVCYKWSSLTVAFLGSSTLFFRVFLVFSNTHTVSLAYTMISTMSESAFNCFSIGTCLYSCSNNVVVAASPRFFFFFFFCKAETLVWPELSLYSPRKVQVWEIPPYLLQLPYLRLVFMFMYAWKLIVTGVNAFVHSIASLFLSLTE